MYVLKAFWSDLPDFAERWDDFETDRLGNFWLVFIGDVCLERITLTSLSTRMQRSDRDVSRRRSLVDSFCSCCLGMEVVDLRADFDCDYYDFLRLGETELLMDLLGE